MGRRARAGACSCGGTLGEVISELARSATFDTSLGTNRPTCCADPAPAFIATALTACSHPTHRCACRSRHWRAKRLRPCLRRPRATRPRALAGALPRINSGAGSVGAALGAPLTRSYLYAAPCAGARCASSLSSSTSRRSVPSSATWASPPPLPEPAPDPDPGWPRRAARRCGSRPPSSTGVTPRHPRLQ
jgi:hypothetical protein